MGDFNSRTGEIQESLHNDMTHTSFNLPNMTLETHIPLRSNKDKKVNKFGKQLIDTMEEAHMLILNGRTLGDYDGKKTCHKYNGNSTVDHMIVSANILNKFASFRVIEPQWFTDHSPLSCQIRLQPPFPNARRNSNMTEFYKYIWDDDSSDKITCALSEPDILENFKHISLIYDSDKCVDSLVDILHTVANKNLVKKTIAGNDKSKECGQYKPHTDNRIIEVKREFKKAKRQYHNSQEDDNKRIKFLSLKNKYKKIKYLVQRYDKEDKIHKLAEIETKQPQLFWKSVKSLMPRNKSKPNINPENWANYFCKLLNIKSANQQKSTKQSPFKEYIEASLPVIESSMETEGPLDYPITEEEISSSLKELKRNKATGPDCINNEILKCTSIALIKSLLHTFNTILNNKTYPKRWMSNIITPIHKSGDINDPKNYRGIAVSDGLNKVFIKTINKIIYN